MTLPEGRYGKRGTQARWKLITAIAAGAVIISVVGILAYTNLGDAPIEAERTAFHVVDGNAMRLDFSVTRDDPSRPAVCIVRVRAIDGAETGRKEVLVPPGGKATGVSTVIRSSREPVTADVFGCSYQVPVYLSTALRPTG